MIVYRVCSATFADLDGEGSRLYGGRWNSPGTPVIYTASSLSLAILETRVHLRQMPLDYIRLTIEIDLTSDVLREIPIEQMVTGWTLDTSISRLIGDTHFSAAPDVPIRVPSVVVDSEWNILFSRNFAARNAKVLESAPLNFDPRLWTV